MRPIIIINGSKPCSKCKEVKPLSEFFKRINRKNGFSSSCKTCHKKYYGNYPIKNLFGFKKCYCCEIEKDVSEFYTSTYSKDGLNCYCKICHDEKTKNWQAIPKNREAKNLQNKQYYSIPENKEKHILYYEQYYQIPENKAARKLNTQIWRYNNKEKCKSNHNANEKHKYKTDINYRTLQILRAMTRRAFNGNPKHEHTMIYIMCSVTEFMAHIEKQWLPGMSWDNYGKGKGKWQIDHIIPCAFFKDYILDEVEKYMCCRYQNL